MTAGGRSAEEHAGGLSVLQETFGGDVRVQVPWEGSHSIRLRQAVGNWKPEEGVEAVVEDGKDHSVGGGRPWTSRNVYKAVVQATLLLRAETWVMSSDLPTL